MTAAPTDAWTALRERPWRFLATGWPLRSLAYLGTTVPIGLTALIVLMITITLGVLTAVIVIGVVLLGTIPAMAGAVGVLERHRLRLIDPRAISAVTLRDRLRARGALSLSWAELGYTLVLGTALWVLDLMVLTIAVGAPVLLVLAPWLATVERMEVLSWEISAGGEAWLAVLVGVVLAVGSAYVVTLVAVAQGALARLLLDPREAELAATVADLRRSRVDLVDAFETERRRIERDLHDGVQQRLVALTMTLGRAELDVPDGAGLEVLRDAQRQAEAALEDLRGTIRGIHPRVLVDHGLVAAVHELAGHAAVPVGVDVHLPGRLPAPVEQAAYFVVSEALTNVARHAGARRVVVHGWLREDRFVLTVEDDGSGGATLDAKGTGLAGLVVRLEALGGDLRVTSPAGGPTEVRMEVPCPA